MEGEVWGDASSSSAQAASGDVNSVAAADATPTALPTRKARRVLAGCSRSSMLGVAADRDKRQRRGFAEGAKARQESAATAREVQRSRVRVIVICCLPPTGRIGARPDLFHLEPHAPT